MNKLDLTQTGGLGLYQDDLAFEQASIREAIKGLLSPVPDCIISGCDVVGMTVLGTSVIRSAEGYVNIDGEIFFSPRIDLAPGAAQYYYEIVEVTDPAGTQTFEDSTTHNIYLVRTVEFKSGASVPGGALEAYSAPRYTTALIQDTVNNLAATDSLVSLLQAQVNALSSSYAQLASTISQAYTSVSLSGLTVTGATLDTSSTFFIKHKLVGSTVYLEAKIKLTATGAGSAFAIPLPLTFINAVTQPVYCTLNGSPDSSVISTGPGYITVTKTLATTDVLIVHINLTGEVA